MKLSPTQSYTEQGTQVQTGTLGNKELLIQLKKSKKAGFFLEHKTSPLSFLCKTIFLKRWKCFFPLIINVKAAGLQKALWHALIFLSNVNISVPWPRICPACTQTKRCSHVYESIWTFQCFSSHLPLTILRIPPALLLFGNQFYCQAHFIRAQTILFFRSSVMVANRCSCWFYIYFFSNKELSLMASTFTIPFKKLSGGECSPV